MGQIDKIPITRERKVTYDGIFDIHNTFKFLKDYLEDSRHYDITERDYEEKKDEKSKRIFANIEAEQEFNDYYKIIIKYSIELNGKSISLKDPKTEKIQNLIEGKAKLIVNGYIEADWQNKRGESDLAKFLDKIYTKYIGKSEEDKCIISGITDINELLGRFKQQINATNK